MRLSSGLVAVNGLEDDEEDGAKDRLAQVRCPPCLAQGMSIARQRAAVVIGGRSWAMLLPRPWRWPPVRVRWLVVFVLVMVRVVAIG